MKRNKAQHNQTRYSETHSRLKQERFMDRTPPWNCQYLGGKLKSAEQGAKREEEPSGAECPKNQEKNEVQEGKNSPKHVTLRSVKNRRC